MVSLKIKVSVKGTVHSLMVFCDCFAHLRVILNLFDLCCSVEHKRRNIEECTIHSFPLNEALKDWTDSVMEFNSIIQSQLSVNNDLSVKQIYLIIVSDSLPNIENSVIIYSP